MPSRNIVKQYVEGGYYHVYNRGVEKRLVYMDEQDYRVFLEYLKSYLTTDLGFFGSRLRANLSDKVQLLSYCLMPNHYHLLIHQESIDGMTLLLRRAMTGYSMYFNRRHGRVGPLFQANFKAALIDTDEYLMHVSRYIHLNPVGIGQYPGTYRFSSWSDYVSERPTWVNTKPVLSLFKGADDYLNFLSNQAIDSKTLLGDLILE